MGSPTVFTGSRTKFISSKGALLKDGSVIDNDGVPNFIKNGHAEIDTTGWATYADAAQSTPVDGTGGVANVTWARSTTTPLAGAGSFIFTKDTSNRQGQGVSYTFSVDPAFRAKVCNIQFDYIFTNINGSFDTSNPNLTVYIYDVTNSTLIQPSSYGFASNSQTIPDTFQASFQTSATGASYRLIFHVATVSTSGYTLKFDNIQVTPTQYAFGTPVTDWVSYTPTFTGLGTVSALTAKWRRVGDSMQVAFTVTSGTNTSSAASITIPSGFTIDSNKIGSNTEVGKLSAEKTPFSGGFIFSSGNTGLVYFTSDSANMTLGAAGTTWANTTVFGGMFTVPILGWSSSVQTSDQTSTRVVAFVGGAINTTITTGTFDVPKIISPTSSNDTCGAYSSGLYTIPVSGFYKITHRNLMNIEAGRDFRVGYTINSTTDFYAAETRNNSGAASVSMNLSCVSTVYLKAGDIVRFAVSMNNTSNTALLLDGRFQTYNIERISGPNQIAASETVSALYTGAPPTGTLGAAYNTVTFGTKVKDSHGQYSSGIYTIPVSGQYDISSAVSINSTWTAGNIYAIGISIDNASPSYSWVDRIEANIVQPKTAELSIVAIPLKAGQNVRIQVYSSGSSQSYEANGSVNYFSINRSGNY